MAHRERHNGFVEYAYAASNTQLNGRSSTGTIKIPDNYNEAMRLPEAHLWKAAMEKELKSHQDLNVYKLVRKSDVPEGKNVIGSKWVFKLKADNKFKARIVAQGWNQVHGRDCYGTYAPVCRLQSIRMVLAIAAEKNWEVI